MNPNNTNMHANMWLCVPTIVSFMEKTLSEREQWRCRVQYKEIEQQKLREEEILKSLQHANEEGRTCKYSEEQIIKAQRQSGRKKINAIYTEEINPVANDLMYFVYIMTELVLMPILYLNKTRGSIIAALIAYLLFFVILIIMQVTENSIKKDTEKNREWIKYFRKFANDTYVLGYILPSLGYLLVVLDSIRFWYIYAAMIIVFSCAIFFDIVIPLVTCLR